MSSNAGQKKANPKQLKSMLISIGSIIILVIAAVSFVFLPAMVSRGARDTHVLGYFRKEPIKRTDEVFLRMLENAGLKGLFIHDESISLQLKYRPDFWFINENLIVEYDETAHKLRTDEDVQREKIIKIEMNSVLIFFNNPIICYCY